jgi:hypothetical protein
LKIQAKDLKHIRDALTLIGGFPLSIDFAWRSAELRRKVESLLEIQDEMSNKKFRELSDSTKNGVPIIENRLSIQVYQDFLAEIAEHELELPDLGLSREQLREFLEKKKDAEGAAIIIHGLLPLLSD